MVFRSRHLWIWLSCGILALLLAWNLGQTPGRAAAPGQTSPLRSPLNTPSIPATPTPTPTSPVPPTATPPAGLIRWPTPTPTPAPEPVAAALAFVARQNQVRPDQLQVTNRLVVTVPGRSGGSPESRTVVQVLDRTRDRYHWVWVTKEGRVGYLPSFAREGRTLAAEEAGVEPDQVELVNENYAIYPFLGRIAWAGRYQVKDQGTAWTVYLDLQGQPVDLAEWTEEHKQAVEETCGALDRTLCTELLTAAEDILYDVQIRASNQDTLEAVLEVLQKMEAPIQVDSTTIITRLTPDQLFTLAPMEDEIFMIMRHYPDRVELLDSHLILGFNEGQDGIALELETRKHYPILGHRVEAVLERVEMTRTRSITLAVDIQGIFTPAFGSAEEGPARATLALGDLSGRYALTLRYSDTVRGLDLEDHYTLLATTSRLVVRPVSMRFTWPRYTTWLRLPPDAIGFVVHARPDAPLSEADDVKTYREAVDAFYADVADLPAHPLRLAEGVYTWRSFVPPWPSWQIPMGNHQVAIPTWDGRQYLWRAPEIRYFTYSGDLDAVRELLDAHCSDLVDILVLTAGDAQLSCVDR